ncbi:MAG: MbcA/ParS/Xre antitoxin family protein [Moraxellaceae bacterium]|nr:MbcA/ParS/Xre antitoxin family protein [Moraxellaceae bacterium]MDZ4386590.1 MbcA/ParS/Xre antitoxin family protein [Moraxellaceae bacterium]
MPNEPKALNLDETLSDVSSIELQSVASRRTHASALMRLFDHWQLSKNEQLALLGLTKGSHERLIGLRSGQPLPNNLDMLDRAGHLFSIHKSLRILFPHDREIVYCWIKYPNNTFDGQTPLEVMLKERFVGILRVRMYLERAAKGF